MPNPIPSIAEGTRRRGPGPCPVQLPRRETRFSGGGEMVRARAFGPFLRRMHLFLKKPWINSYAGHTHDARYGSA